MMTHREPFPLGGRAGLGGVTTRCHVQNDARTRYAQRMRSILFAPSPNPLPKGRGL